MMVKQYIKINEPYLRNRESTEWTKQSMVDLSVSKVIREEYKKTKQEKYQKYEGHLESNAH